MSRMKHVKLFEEFKEVSIYELIKDLPMPNPIPTSYGVRNSYRFINISDNDKIFAVINELKNEGLIVLTKFDDVIKSGNSQSIIWYKTHYSVKDVKFSPNEDFIEVKFEDHFKMKPDYRGHNLKKYNV